MRLRKLGVRAKLTRDLLRLCVVLGQKSRSRTNITCDWYAILIYL